MFINFNVSAVKAGSFVNDEKETIEYGYVYAVGEFRDSSNTENFQTGIQIQKFKCRDKLVLSTVRAALLKAKGAVDIQLDIDFSAKEGAISVPSVVGVLV
jgi:hypothetical protein